MFVQQIEILILILLSVVFNSEELEELPSVDNHVIVSTESIIRRTLNKLFLDLKLGKGIQLNPKLKQLSTVHNFLASVSLKDQKALNKIVELSRIDKRNINNETAGFMTALNEVLNEDAMKSFEDVDFDENIVHYVDEFLTNLGGFKETSGVNDNYEDFDINAAVLKILQNAHEDKFNVSKQNETVTTVADDDNVLSDNEFWVPEQQTRRIYRGDRTKIKYFPFMASIQIFNSFQCGGSIIKSDLILTAASCLQLAYNNRFFRENPAFLSARVGSNFYNGGGENIPVLEVYFHPEYNPRNLKNNICILRLLRKLKFRKNKRRLKKIDIDRNPSALPMTTDGITVVGWGARGPSNVVRDPWSNQLAFAVLDVYHLQECQDIYSREYVTGKNFCAGFVSKGGGACNHDVGGPGIANGILAGIISFGSPVCGTPDAPTVFTKVGYYADWIEEVMEQDVPYLIKRTTLSLPRLPFTVGSIQHKKPTTFKIPPIAGKLEPIPIVPVYIGDTLRILEDEDLFKEFLKTMFNSEEANEYKDLLDETHDKPKAHRAEAEIPVAERPEEERKHAVTVSVGYQTNYADYKDSTVPNKKITMLDQNLSADDDLLDRNIVKLISNIDVSDEEDTITSINESEEERFIPAIKTTAKTAKVNKKIKNVDDPILTLLYMSDDEKNNTNFDDIGDAIEDFNENINDGLSIPKDGFKDLTLRIKDKDSMFESLSKNELYDLMNEAIADIANEESELKP